MKAVPAVCRQKKDSNQPYIFALVETIERAKSLSEYQNGIDDKNHYWPQWTNEGTTIGEECNYTPANIKTVKVIDHSSNKTGCPGFHGKYNSKTGKNKPEERDYKPIQIVIGSIYRSEKSPGDHPAYGTIQKETTITRNCIGHLITIENNQVFLNGVIIARAPEKKTKTQKETFCKSIVWGLLNDDATFADKLNEIGYTEPATVQEPDICIENITLSPFPGPGIVEEIEYTEMYAYREKERDAINTIIIEYGDDPEESIYDIAGSYLNPENNPENANEIINAFNPPVNRYAYLRCTIQEVTV